jgi:L-amino acid N-acyltransferase YncA
LIRHAGSCKQLSSLGDVLIRDADAARDAGACAAIYAPSVENGVASFEERAPSVGEMAARIQTTSAGWPWLIAEVDGAVAGLAYGSGHRARAAYRWAADVSVYVDPAHHRRGVGRALYVALLQRLVDQGFYEACAGIALPNPPSVGLHESLGFRPVGVYRGIGFKLGHWWDVGWWQRTLRPHENGQIPPEPRPPTSSRR